MRNSSQYQNNAQYYKNKCSKKISEKEGTEKQAQKRSFPGRCFFRSTDNNIMSTPIEIRKLKSVEKPVTTGKNTPNFHPREPGIHFIRDVKTRFDQQYLRIPLGPNYKKQHYVTNPFRPKIH